MNAVSLSKSEQNKSVVTPEEFMGIISELDSIVRKVAIANPKIDHSLFYELEIWNGIKDNPTLKTLWGAALAEWIRYITYSPLMKLFEEQITPAKPKGKGKKPKTTALSLGTMVASEDDEEEAVETIISDEKEIKGLNPSPLSMAKKVYEVNADAITEQWKRFIYNTQLPDEYFLGLYGSEMYWDNMERFISHNWAEIFSWTEGILDGTVTIAKDIDYPSDKLAENPEIVKALETLYRNAGVIMK